MPTKEELRQLQALPLDLKIARTQQRIREWVRHYGVKVYGEDFLRYKPLDKDEEDK